MFRDFNSPEYIAWRKAIFKRDEYACQYPECGSKNKIQAHHILKWASYPELRFVVSNGIILCQEHHELTIGQEDLFVELFTNIINNKSKKIKNTVVGDPFLLDRILKKNKDNGKKRK